MHFDPANTARLTLLLLVILVLARLLPLPSARARLPD